MDQGPRLEKKLPHSLCEIKCMKQYILHFQILTAQYYLNAGTAWTLAQCLVYPKSIILLAYLEDNTRPLFDAWHDKFSGPFSLLV